MEHTEEYIQYLGTRGTKGQRGTSKGKVKIKRQKERGEGGRREGARGNQRIHRRPTRIFEEELRRREFGGRVVGW